MSLTVTVQKGHDFSSGNVTRAALNAGAVPTVAVTGSVGTSELAADAITATELADDAVTTSHILDVNVTTAKIADNAVDLTKLVDYDSLKRGTLIKTGDTAEEDTIIPETFEANTASKILIGDGNDLLSLGHETADEDDGDTTKDQPKSHVEIGLTTPVADAVTTGVLLTLKNFAIKVGKLAKNIVAGTATPGIIVYDNVGVASVLASTGVDSRVLTTNDTATPSFKVVNKVLHMLGVLDRTTYGTSGSSAIDSTDRVFVKAHGLTAVTSVSAYIECVVSDNGYAVGDKVSLAPAPTLVHAEHHRVIISWDNANIAIHFNRNPSIHPKATASADSYSADAYIVPTSWKVMALVSE
jgi:hypothetical protein